jgi:hypothetical protein
MRQYAVDEGKWSVDEIQDTAVFLYHCLHKESGLFAHVVEQLIIYGREARRIGLRTSEVSKLQPLRREIVDEVGSFRIGHHAPRLLRQHIRPSQLSLVREPRQLLIRHAGPQEVRQPRRQFVIADGMSAGCRLGVALQVEQKIGRDENRLEREP